MKMRRYYIGLDVFSTVTGRLQPKGQRAKTIKAFRKCAPLGFTAQDAVGYWDGTTENTLVITIAGDLEFAGETDHDTIVSDLCEFLEQVCIAVEEGGEMRLVYREGGRQ